MNMNSQRPEPVRPPDSAPRLSLTRKQILGLPLLAAIPVLTLFGAFGESRHAVRVTSSALEMTVRYPSRFRYRQVQSLEVTVRNRSGRALDTVSVSLDTAYITRFSSVRIEPAPRETYVVKLVDLAPHQSRLVSAELWGERYGSHKGRIVAAAGADSASTEIRTIVFP
jgi:hypothetical protein